MTVETFFSDVSEPGYSISSTWKSRAILATGSCQTNPIEMVAKESQVVSTINEQTQTLEVQSTNSIKIDWPNVAEFLRRVEGLVSKELLDNISSQAFDDYAVEWEEKVEDTTIEYTLSHSNRDLEAGCTDLVWNKTGSIIAASYGHESHFSWCSHKGLVCAWNLVIRDLNPTSAFFSFETLSCLTSLAFHPSHPSVLAGGTFNGDILIWSLYADKDPLVCSSSSGKQTHSEPVTQLCWKPTSRANELHLVSLSPDGKLLLWDPSNKLNKPYAGCQFLVGGLPNYLRPKNARHDAVLGGISMILSPLNDDEMIVGTETGHIFRANLNQATSIPHSGQVTFGNAITFGYAPHIGPVLSLSTMDRQSFLSVGDDGMAHLYNIYQTASISTLEPSGISLTGVTVSPKKSLLFAISCADGSIALYNLEKNESLPIATLEQEERSSVTGIAFHPRQLGFLASCDSLGRIFIWKLASHLIA